jgi:hypothetical protein
MRTAASAYDGGTIGIVLSGSRDDGTAGLMAIKAGGGMAIVQDPEEALYPAMPRSAMAHIEPDAVLPVGAMAAWILERTRTANVGAGGGPTTAFEEPAGDPGHEIATDGDPPRSATGRGTRFTCPDCGGVLSVTKGRSSASGAASGTCSRSRASPAPRRRRSRPPCGRRCARSTTAPRCSSASARADE